MLKTLREVTKEEIEKLNEVNKEILNKDELFEKDSCVLVEKDNKKYIYTENPDTGIKLLIDTNTYDMKKAETSQSPLRDFYDIFNMFLFGLFTLVTCIAEIVGVSYIISIVLMQLSSISGLSVILGTITIGLITWFIYEYRNYIAYKSSFLERICPDEEKEELK